MHEGGGGRRRSLGCRERLHCGGHGGGPRLLDGRREVGPIHILGREQRHVDAAAQGGAPARRHSDNIAACGRVGCTRGVGGSATRQRQLRRVAHLDGDARLGRRRRPRGRVTLRLLLVQRLTRGEACERLDAVIDHDRNERELGVHVQRRGQRAGPGGRLAGDHPARRHRLAGAQVPNDSAVVIEGAAAHGRREQALNIQRVQRRDRDAAARGTRVQRAPVAVEAAAAPRLVERQQRWQQARGDAV